YSPFFWSPMSPPVCSVIAISTRAPARRPTSIASCTLPYFRFTSALKNRILSLVRPAYSFVSVSSTCSLVYGFLLKKYLPSASSPSVSSSLPSGAFSVFDALGMVAVKPASSIGVTIMKMISSTSITSIIGVTLMFALTWPGPLPVDMATATYRLLSLELLGEDRAAKLAPHALDQVVDQFLGGVGHLDRQVFDLGREVVVRPHRRD